MEISVFKKTPDDWHPSFKLSGYLDGGEEQGLVEVTLFSSATRPKPPVDETWHVCVCGADDFGMGKDFSEEKTARECFHRILCMEQITVACLKHLEFTVL